MVAARSPPEPGWTAAAATVVPAASGLPPVRARPSAPDTVSTAARKTTASALTGVLLETGSCGCTPTAAGPPERAGRPQPRIDQAAATLRRRARPTNPPVKVSRPTARSAPGTAGSEKPGSHANAPEPASDCVRAAPEGCGSGSLPVV